MKIKHVAICDKGHEFPVEETVAGRIICGYTSESDLKCPHCEAEKPSVRAMDVILEKPCKRICIATKRWSNNCGFKVMCPEDPALTGLGDNCYTLTGINLADLLKDYKEGDVVVRLSKQDMAILETVINIRIIQLSNMGMHGTAVQYSDVFSKLKGPK